MPRTMMLRIATAAAVGNCPGSCRHRSLHENVPSLHRDFSCCLVNTVNRCSSPRGSLMLMSVQYRSSMDLVCRTSRGVRCNAQKGFGTSVPKRKGAKSGPAKTPEQAAERALAEAAGPRSKVRPIDPREAARGKVDYVQVKDWANGQAGDIGELAMVPGTLSTGFTAGSSSPSAAASAAAAAAAAAEDSGPFWQQLAQHAQYLERQGALSIADMRGAKPYMPFEAWQYNLQRYKQYLAEIVAVHQAIEAALQLALSAQNPSSSSSSSSSGQAAWAVPGRNEQVLQAYSALQCFGLESGLWRAAAAAADLHTLSAAAHGAKVDSSSTAGSQQPNSQGAAHKQKSSSQAEVQASQNAVAYGRYILQLGQAAAAATAEAAAAAGAATAAAAGSSSTGLSAGEAEGRAAALKLLAHAYALQVQQQCLGARIGAAATEKLQLLPARALAVYMDYPDSINGEPVEHLMELTDAAGQILDAAGRQAVFEELPKALKKSALMLAPLATAE